MRIKATKRFSTKQRNRYKTVAKELSNELPLPFINVVIK